MARQPRLCVPGLAHHVVQRGHSGAKVFFDDEDRQGYLAALDEALHRQQVSLLAYALLDDEVHLLLVPSSAEALARVMQSLGRRYVATFNRRHGRSGTLWDGRFRAGVVQRGIPTLQCMQFIDGLPLRRGLVETPESSRWCSAPHRLGRARDPGLTSPPEYWSLGNTPFDREAAYAQRLAHGLDAVTEQRIELAARRGLAFGAADFVAQLASDTGRPLRARPRGRPARPVAPSAG